MKKSFDVASFLSQLDGSGSVKEWEIIHLLRSELKEEFPSHLLELYNRSRKWNIRISCVYHATRYSRTVEDALTLGIVALKDKSRNVRQRACRLLAWSLNPKALKYLYDAVKIEQNQSVRTDILAAIDAIKSKNSDYFVDRDRSGMIKLVIN